MLNKLINLLVIKSLFKIEFKIINLEYNFQEIINVDNFNKWFNDPNKSPDIYAHAGIFLRTDKLSGGHFDDYFLSCEGIDNLNHFKEELTFNEYYDFENAVRKDWLEKQK
jgi:hypothetical protein